MLPKFPTLPPSNLSKCPDLLILSIFSDGRGPSLRVIFVCLFVCLFVYISQVKCFIKILCCSRNVTRVMPVTECHTKKIIRPRATGEESWHPANL